MTYACSKLSKVNKTTIPINQFLIRAPSFELLKIFSIPSGSTYIRKKQNSFKNSAKSIIIIQTSSI